MNRILKNVLLLSAVTLPLAGPAMAADTYTLDPNHTNVFWQANHLGFSNPSGKFGDVTGTLTLDEAKPENSKVDVLIKPAVMVTGIAKFDDHLKSKDFFNVDKFPTATFKSTKVERIGDDAAKVTGDLTLLGVTKPVVLDVKLNKIGDNPMSKIKTAGFSATTTIKRSDFGMDMAIPNVSDEVKITIESEANIVKAGK